MEERSKTIKELYLQKYHTKEVLENPMSCAEAIGYLKALKDYFPSKKKWVEGEIEELMIRLLFFSL